MAPESPTSARRPTAAAGRAWLTLAGIILVVIALTTMVVAPLLASRTATDRRDRLANDIEPYRSALDEYRLDVVKLAAETRAYAATRSPGSRVRFFESVARQDADTDALRARAVGAGFKTETDDVVALGDHYRSVASRIIEAEDRADDVESSRLIEQEGEPGLVALDAEAERLTAAVDAVRDDLRADIRDVDRRERYGVVVAGGLGLLAAAALGGLVISNTRLGRRVARDRQHLDDVISDVPGVVYEAWGTPDAATQQIDFVSQHVEEMLGYSVEDWLKTPNFWLTIVHPADREQAANAASAHFNRGGTDINRFRWLAKDGRVLWVQAFSTVITNERGIAVGMRGVVTDITEQRRAEEALERERARFASIIASIDYGVYQVDTTGSLIYMNPAAELLLGYSTSEVVGRDAHATFHSTRPDGSPLSLEECRICRDAREDTTYRGIETFSAKDGRRIPVDVACADTIIEGSGTGSGAVIVFQDITERLRQESLKDDFVAFASHELRNPLTSVKGFSRWLAGRVEAAPATFDDDVQSAISTLVEESDRMESIVELFLDLAVLDANRMSFEMEPIDLRRLLNDECDRLRLRYPSAGCDAIMPGLTLFAASDDHRLRQVIGNLLDNAAKYSGEGAQVRVALEQDGEWATLRITDNGPGIPVDDQPFIFDRYYRGRGAIASRRKGLGVGLYITKQLVDRLGGTLTFTSSGAGTEFVLRLPLIAIEFDDVP